MALFGVDVAGLLANTLSPSVEAVTLVRVEPGTRVASTSGSQPTTSSYHCRGWLDTKRGQTKDTLERVANPVVVLLGDTVSATPRPSDRVTIAGRTLEVVAVDADPQNALYMLTCRGG